MERKALLELFQLGILERVCHFTKTQHKKMSLENVQKNDNKTCQSQRGRKKKVKKSVLQLATFAKSKINSSSKRQEINERKVILKEGLNQRKNGKWKKVNKSNIALLDVEFFFQSLKNKANITCLLCGNQISYKSNEFVNRAMSKVSFTCSNGFSKQLPTFQFCQINAFSFIHTLSSAFLAHILSSKKFLENFLPTF